MIGRIVRKAWTENILLSVLVELTYRCNLDCWFCYNDLGLKGRPLSDEQILGMLDELAALQVLNLTFTGGEPLAHPSFLRFGERAKELGFIVRLKTNGHALRGRLLEEIRERVDPFLVEISLHGADAAVHDKQTRVPGSFERLRQNLVELRATGQRTKLNATLTRWNEHQMHDLFAFADDLGVPLSITPTVTPRDDGDTSPLGIAPSPEGVKALYALLDERVPDDKDPTCTQPAATSVRPGEKNCGAGASGLAVDPMGTVYPCVQWRRPLGSLHDQSITEIWRTANGLGEIRDISRQARERVVALGESAVGYGHCMGISEEKTGDPLAIDADAMANARQLQQMRAEKRELLPVLQ